MQNEPSRDCFDSGHLEKLIMIINQDTQDKPYIEEKAKQVRAKKIFVCSMIIW